MGKKNTTFFRQALQARVESGEFREIGSGGADGDGVQSTEFIEIRPLARSKAGLGVLHYLDKTLVEVDAKNAIVYVGQTFSYRLTKQENCIRFLNV